MQPTKHQKPADDEDYMSPLRLHRGDVGQPTNRNSRLRIVTDTTQFRNMNNNAPNKEEEAAYPACGQDSDTESLFGDTSSPGGSSDDMSVSGDDESHLRPALRTAPPIPGLYFDPTLRLPAELAEEVMWTCIRTYFQSSDVDQIMLFQRASPSSSSGSALPPVLTSLLSALSTLLQPLLPPEKHALLFPAHPTPFARQVILNFYWPGDGITPHVDLLDRYGDGIIGVSLGSGCVMQFSKAQKAKGGEVTPQQHEMNRHEDRDHYGLYLPPGSVIVLTAESRYLWTHGIERRMEDLVESTGSQHEHSGAAVVRSDYSFVARDVRLSITFRWLLPGADVVGPPGFALSTHS